MTTLEQLTAGTHVRGLAPVGQAKVVAVQWFGDQAVEVVYEDESGGVKKRLLYRSDESRLDLISAGRPWSFDADGELLRLVSEAYRIRLAHLFDPYLAVHTSRIEALPHQITAVYQSMLSRQPLRFLLADDPGAGKTIMTGLLIKELMIRGDLERCLIVAPGNLVEQWQDELHDKFGLPFDILTRDQIEASRKGNPFEERNALIARLDMLARDEDLQEKLARSPHWDLIVCDEAHKMSASFFGGEVKYTKRHLLGRKIGGLCRHFLLLTATPHNGKEEDYQLFMSLLDGDRFEGRFRDGVHKADTADLMRRLVKEELLKFDGKPLFPERCAYTVGYELSDAEAALYADVTDYVRDEMNRAERFANADDQRRVNVGFALQTLQRRLASSPEAIYQSLRRRRERLEARVEEEKLIERGHSVERDAASTMPLRNADDVDDLDDAPEDEVESAEERVLDRATASRTIAELKTEIETLARLEAQARRLRSSGVDTKWRQLDSILDDELMVDAQGHRRKLIIFTEPKDTLRYLAERIRQRLGKPEAVVEIHGGVRREERRKVVEAFTQDKDVLILVANDAAGEGVNLQRAHLMVNYDLPWNPNRLEQRFGRIHRIGQREVCHLWNLVAQETREGEVYKRLLEKIEAERAALGGRVYDVLGQAFRERPLRELLVDAIRYGERPDVRARLDKEVDSVVDHQRLLDLLEERALVRETMDAGRVAHIREEMERAQVQRLQPHFIRTFFLEAFRRLGGRIHRREPGRYEITRVPGPIRDRDRQIGTGAPVLKSYERITFEKEHIEEIPRADLVCPGHPLFDSTVDLILERHRSLLKQGTVLVDEDDQGTDVRVLYYLEHSVQDGRTDARGNQQIVSQRLQFVEIDETGRVNAAGPAPYLDYRPVSPEERQALDGELDVDWLRDDPERPVLDFAVRDVIPNHVEGVRSRILPLVDKTEAQVKARLTKEINHWDHRAQDLKAQERAGKKTRLSSANAQARADDLADRMRRREAELALQREIVALPPMIVGGTVIVPAGLLRRVAGDPNPEPPSPNEPARDVIERKAMEAVIAAERDLGREPRDVSSQRGLGYDIESKDSNGGSLHFIEVKGRWHTKPSVTLTKNEILCSRNEPERWRLAVVVIDDDGAQTPRYLIEPSFGEPDFAETTRTFSLGALLGQAGEPR